MKRVKLLYSSDDFNNVEELKYMDAHNDLSEEAKKLIKLYLEPTCEAKTTQMIQGFIEQKLGEKYSTHRVKQYLNKRMALKQNEINFLIIKIKVPLLSMNLKLTKPTYWDLNQETTFAYW